MPVPNELTESAVEGARPISARLDNGNALPCKADKPWYFVHYPDHPGNWFAATIDAGEGVPEDEVGVWWLPFLQKEVVQAGLNNHRLAKKGMTASYVHEAAHNIIRRDGGIVLPHSLGYIREVDCIDPLTQNGGIKHIDVWSTPRRTVVRGQRLKFEFDRQRYYRWLLNLMRNGDLPLPDMAVLDVRKGQAAERVERINRGTGYAPGVKEADLAEARARADVVERAKVADPEAATSRVKAPGRRPGPKNAT